MAPLIIIIKFELPIHLFSRYIHVPERTYISLIELLHSSRPSGKTGYSKSLLRANFVSLIRDARGLFCFIAFSAAKPDASEYVYQCLTLFPLLGTILYRMTA